MAKTRSNPSGNPSSPNHAKIPDKKSSFFVTPRERQEIAKVKETFKRNAKSKNGKAETHAPNAEKKPFDKKKWRVQKYSKKYKLDQWAAKRKRALVNEYYKQVKDDEQGFNVKKIYDQYEDEQRPQQEAPADDDNDNNTNDAIENERAGPSHRGSTQQKRTAFRKAHLAFDRVREEKKQKREEYLQRKAEKEESLKKYKQAKLEKYKKLNKKTRKGQPVMKYRMEMLLEQIQKSIKP